MKPLAASGYIVSGGGVAPFASEVVSEVILQGEQALFLSHLKEEYARRSKKMTLLLQDADVGFEVHREVTGGYFTWVRLPDDLHAEKLLREKGEEFGVSYLPGSRCDPAQTGLYDSSLQEGFITSSNMNIWPGSLARIALYATVFGSLDSSSFSPSSSSSLNSSKPPMYPA